MTALAEQGTFEVEPGVRIHYSIRGSAGPALVVPNGSWVAGPLLPLGRGRRIVSYDLRNRGLSSPVEDKSAARGLASTSPTSRRCVATSGSSARW